MGDGGLSQKLASTVELRESPGRAELGLRLLSVVCGSGRIGG